MANIRLLSRLEKIENEMEQIERHVHMHSGVSKKDAQKVIWRLEGISRLADRIFAAAKNPIKD